MNILCVLERGTWAERHIAGSLRALGHRVSVFHHSTVGVGDFYGSARGRERADKNRRLLDLVRELRNGPGLELIFCYVYDDFLQESTARALARFDIPMVNYNVDMVSKWFRQTITAPYFTRMLCAQRANMAQLARYNRKVLHFPMAAIAPVPGDEAQRMLPAAPVTFIGTPMPYRARVLLRLHEKALPLAVYGKYWQEGRYVCRPASREKMLHDIRHYAVPKFRAEGLGGLAPALRQWLAPGGATLVAGLPPRLFAGFAPEPALRSLFAQSAINLGFTRVSGDDPDAAGISQVRLRDFEVPSAGGFYLVERTSEHDEYFRPGVEIESWRTPQELIDKIRYYLGHPSERQRIAAAGMRRAAAEHTWGHRFAMLFADLGLAA
ncbi:MAG: glycosyltransferase family protein [Casimicrobiaceae bacterium]